MGCVSSKHIKKDLKKETILNGARSSYTNHVVSLTSSTYGALKLDKDAVVVVVQPTPPVSVQKSENSPARKSTNGPTEVINAWELMEDLEDEPKGAESGPGKKSPKLRRGLGEIDVKTTPMKVVVNPIGSSPKVLKRFTGKENKKASTLPPNLRISKKGGCESPVDSGLNSARRKNLGLLFDPDRVDPNAKKKVQENKENKKVGLGGLGTPTSQKARNSVESTAMLAVFEKKSPPGGENAVVIYTTTLRGIRKTFEECNIVRGIIESHQVRIIERDVSMDSGFKEELRALLGKKEVKVPVVLIKGRLIGGSEEIMKLEEEGKLGILLDGIPTKAEAGCKGCCGVRFVMCTVCNGSCKLIGGDGRRSVKCLECNENGLVQCPFCC
ncbi:putative glutaredoxin, Thioredoxin-like superfamily [Helianthus anomalus]